MRCFNRAERRWRWYEEDDGCGRTASREGHGRLRRCDAGTALEAFVLGINRVGEGSRAAGVTNRWLGGAQALCSNQTNHVAELRMQLTTRSHTWH